MTMVLTVRDEELLANMEDSINDLAMRWRGTRDPETEKEIVERYQTILRCMIDLGFHQSLDADAELPDELLPQEYLNLFN